MTVVRVKICGICTPGEAAVAVEEGADAVGFVFAESPRRLNPGEAARITEKIPLFVSRTGVFADEDINNVLEVAKRCSLDTLQFHGGESPEYCRQFAGFRVIKAFAATSALSYEQVQKYRVDAILLDTKYKDKKGGGGQTFDWRLASPFSDGMVPLILAGGLSPENVYNAIKTVKPYAVDVSTGVEEGGRKNRAKIRKLIKEVRSFNVTIQG